MTAPSTNASAIPSVQLIAAGVPRFFVPATDDAHWAIAAEVEAAGGVEAEVRAFLDAQLETGDVLLDLNPGFGFVALSATTAPGGMPTVLVAGLGDERMQSLQDAATDAGGWLEALGVAELASLAETIDGRLEPEGRIFVHTIAANVGWVCATLADAIANGRLLSICISDAFEANEWDTAQSALTSAGFTACTMVERDGEAVILPCVGHPTSIVIALPSAIIGTNTDSVVDAAIHDDPDVAPAPADDGAWASDVAPPNSASRLAPTVLATPMHADVFPISTTTAPVVVDSRWNITRDGISFIAPHARTGYGVVGANLLSALQRRNIPVAFFPMGAVDRALTENPHLDAGLRLQGAYRPDVPSVRLAQQFDLALHAGRGKHVAFTMFELDRFSDSEIHQLQQQDAILVCSEWARQVCLDNGLTEVPIHVVPLGVDRAVFHEQVTPSTTWQETVFMQIGKLETRKGQRELLAAFEAAFTPKDNVRLVLVCGNPFKRPAELESLLAPFRASPMALKITIIANELPRAGDVAGLMAGADCGVFPVRAEGWNLEALEMLSMGKPVIATACTAHNEYLTLDNARLIRIDGFERAVIDGVPQVGQWAAWNDAQHQQLVAHLRDVHSRKQSQALPRNDAGIRTAQRYSWDHSADCFIRALDAIV